MASRIASVAAFGLFDRGVGAALQGGDEEADLFRVFFQLLAAGDQDQLVVGRDAELVDRGDDRLLAAFAQVDALDVAVAAEHRLGAAADQGREQAEADVDRLDVGGGELGAGEDRLQEGVLVGDAGGGDGLALAGPATPLIPDFCSQIIEVSGRLTSAATATTSRPCSWASTTSGS